MSNEIKLVSANSSSTPSSDTPPIQLLPEEVSAGSMGGFHAPLCKWLHKHTGYNKAKQELIRITKAYRFFNYRLKTDVFSLNREFCEKLYKTTERENREGAQLDRDCLWHFEDKYLDYNYLKESDKAQDILFKMPETESVISCPTCREVGVVTCPTCKGKGEVRCSKCHGRGEIEKTVKRECPVCHGTGMRYNQTCPRCKGLLTPAGQPGKGTVEDTVTLTCPKCHGSGEVTCTTCHGRGEIRCPSCDGVGHVEHIWAISQKYIHRHVETNYRDRGYSDLLELLPEGEEKDRKQLMSWENTEGAITCDISKDVKGGDIEKHIASDIEKAANSSENGKKVIAEHAELYKACHYVKVEFLYGGKTYCAWFDFVDPKRIYEFESDGFCAAWKRAKKNYYRNHNFFHHLMPRRIDFLRDAPVELSDVQKELFSKSLTVLKQPKGRNGQQTTTTKQSVEVGKSRNIYILLALLIPGVHNLYAGYTIRGAIQFVLTITGVGLIVSWPWSFVEAIVVKKDGEGDEMKSGSFFLMFLIFVAFWVLFCYLMCQISASNSGRVAPDGRETSPLNGNQQNTPDLNSIPDFSGKPEVASPDNSASFETPTVQTNEVVQSEETDKVDVSALMIQQRAEDMEKDEVSRSLMLYLYTLSPEHYVSAEFIPQKNGKSFNISKTSGDNFSLSADVAIKISTENPKLELLFNTLHETYGKVAPTKKRVTRHLSTTNDRKEYETTGCDPATVASLGNYPVAVTYSELDLAALQDRASTDYILIRDIKSEDMIAYGFPRSENPLEVTLGLVKSALNQFGGFAFNITMHLLDKNKQQIAEITKEIRSVGNCGQPMYGYADSGSGQPLFMVDTLFYGGQMTYGSAAHGDLVFPVRMIHLDCTIPSDKLAQLDSITFSFDAPSFKVSESQVAPFAEKAVEISRKEEAAEKNQADNAVSVTQQPTAPQPLPDTASEQSHSADSTQPSSPPSEPTPSQASTVVPEQDSTSSDSTEQTPRNGMSPEDLAQAREFADGLSMVSSRASAEHKRNVMYLMERLEKISEGAQVDDVDDSEPNALTALQYACLVGATDIVDWLVKHNADVNYVSDENCTPLDYVRPGYAAQEIRRILKDAGGKTHAQLLTGDEVVEDRRDLQPMIDRMTALHCRNATSALYRKRLLTLLPLVRDGAPVDITLPETKGNTALHYACGIGSLSIVRWLVEHGANVNAVTNKGATPLDCVGSDNAAQIRSVLISAGARR